MIINSRTGSVVMNREVSLDSCAVAQGNLSVTVTAPPTSASRIPRLRWADGGNAANPDRFASGGLAAERTAQCQPQQRGACLNALGATPMDLMSILQSMQSAGCLRAKLKSSDADR